MKTYKIYVVPSGARFLFRAPVLHVPGPFQSYVAVKSPPEGVSAKKIEKIKKICWHWTTPNNQLTNSKTSNWNRIPKRGLEPTAYQPSGGRLCREMTQLRDTERTNAL